MSLPTYIVFTDLDGTLLDHDTYAYDAALPGLRLLQEHQIPLVFCSAKTRAEQMFYREKLQVDDPFIVENGAAVIVRQNYFHQPHAFTKTADGFQFLELGKPYAEIRKVLAQVRTELNLPLQGYGDLTVDEVVQLTGLSSEAASRAMQREYEETVVTQLNDTDRERLRQALMRRNVSMISGARFTSVSAANDKGRAANALTDMFRRERGQVTTVGIGDSWNDAPLLAVMDIPLLVQRPGGSWVSLPVNRIRQITGIGPKGWTQAMRRLVESGFRGGAS